MAYLRYLRWQNNTKITFSPFYDGDEGFLVTARLEMGLEVLPLQGEGGEGRRNVKTHMMKTTSKDMITWLVMCVNNCCWVFGNLTCEARTTERWSC